MLIEAENWRQYELQSILYLDVWHMNTIVYI